MIDQVLELMEKAHAELKKVEGKTGRKEDSRAKLESDGVAQGFKLMRSGAEALEGAMKGRDGTADQLVEKVLKTPGIGVGEIMSGGKRQGGGVDLSISLMPSLGLGRDGGGKPKGLGGDDLGDELSGRGAENRLSDLSDNGGDELDPLEPSEQALQTWASGGDREDALPRSSLQAYGGDCVDIEARESRLGFTTLSIGLTASERAQVGTYIASVLGRDAPMAAQQLSLRR